MSKTNNNEVTDTKQPADIAQPADFSTNLVTVDIDAIRGCIPRTPHPRETWAYDKGTTFPIIEGTSLKNDTLTCLDGRKNHGKAPRWFDFTQKFEKPATMPCSVLAYNTMDKDEKRRIKIGPFFIPGHVAPGVRKVGRGKSDIVARTMLAFDMDRIPEGVTTNDAMAEIQHQLQGVAHLIYTTASHTDTNPKMRVVVPLLAPIDTIDRFESAMRFLAAAFDGWVDACSFKWAQLMYYPRIPKGATYRVEMGGGAPFDADAFLSNLADAGVDVMDCRVWPRTNSETAHTGASNYLGAARTNPTKIPGVVGVFNATYNIHEAIEAFDLPYDFDDDMARGSFNDGASTNGACVYDWPGEGVELPEGEQPVQYAYLYSHHGTDPANNGHSVTAFDLVRIHKFGHHDAKSNTVITTELPSYRKMIQFATHDPRVKETAKQTFLDAPGDEFEAFNGGDDVDHVNDVESVASVADDVPVDSVDDAGHGDGGGNGGSDGAVGHSGSGGDDDGGDDEPALSKEEILEMLETTVNKAGEMRIKPTVCNVCTLLTHDRKSPGLPAFDNWMQRPSVKRWKDGTTRLMSDMLVSQFIYHLSTYWKMEVPDRTFFRAFDQVAKDNAFNNLQTWLGGLEWDGVKRVDTLLHDYFGTPNDEYHAAVMRHTLLGGVMRAMVPGCKYEQLLVLEGGQGAGKSLFVESLAFKQEWHSQQVDFHDEKRAAEKMRGRWIIEIGELVQVRRSTVERVKEFLSTNVDSVRFSYDRFTMDMPRACIFIGTTNATTYLTDTSGNRRFMPVHIPKFKDGQHPMHYRELESMVPQLWAEAMQMWRDMGTPKNLDVPDALQRQIAAESTTRHANYDFAQDLADWLDEMVDPNANLSKDFGTVDDNGDDVERVQRTEVCGLEIREWVTAHPEHKHIADFKTVKFRNVLEHAVNMMEGWELVSGELKRFGRFGPQRMWLRRM